MKNVLLFLILFLYIDTFNNHKYNRVDYKVTVTKKLEKKFIPAIDSLHLVIGDSQSPYIANASDSVELISKVGGESSLWLGGKTVSWLILALRKYQENEKVASVVLSIGTNGGFGKFIKDDISTLILLVKQKFPKAKIYAVQGSWGWGGLKNIKESEVRLYYQKYAELGVIIVEPPIGNIEPHGNKPIYKIIGNNLDSLISL